jgi:MFS family permease
MRLPTFRSNGVTAEAPLAEASTPAPLWLPGQIFGVRFYYGWYIVGLAFAVSMMATGLQAYTLGVFLKPMIEELGWTRVDISLGQTISTFGMGVVGFLIGPLLDRRGGRALMVGGALLMGAGFALLGFVTELWQYYLVKGVLITAGAGAVGALVINVALSNWFVRKRGRAIAIGSMGISMAAMLLPLVSTYLIESFGWRVAWQIIGVSIPTIIVPLALVIMRRRPEDHGLEPDGGGAPPDARVTRAMSTANVRWTRRQALRTPSLWMLVLTFALAGMGLSAILLHLIPFLTDTNFTPAEAAVAFGVIGVTGLVAKPLWGMALDRFPARYCAASEFLLMAAGIALVLSSRDVATLYPSMLVLGLGIGGVVTVQEVIWAEYFGRLTLGAVRGLARPFSVVASAGGPVFAGAAYDIGGSYDVAFLSFVAAYVVAAAVVVVTPYPRDPAEARADPQPASVELG